MEEAPRRRSLLGPLEIIMLIIGLGIIAYVTFQGGGGQVMERSETIKILDSPNGPKEKARRYNAANEESVESLLQNMAEQFSEEENPKSKKKKPILSSTKNTATEKLSKDEKKYYETVRENVSIQDKIESARDWYRILSASQQTYSKVKEIFGEASQQPEEKVNPERLDKELKNPETSSDFYQKLSESFNIDPEDIEAFGRTGQRALSDWAEFVQQKSED